MVLILFRTHGVRDTFDLSAECSHLVDVEIFHLESREALSFSNITIVETGPVRAALRAEMKLANSTFVTTVSSLVIVYFNLIIFF